MRSKLIKTVLAISIAAIVLLIAAFMALAGVQANSGFERTEGQKGRLNEKVNEKAYVVAYNQDNLIRFHVIANSDSEKDQALKRRVRDLIVQKMTPEFEKAQTIEDARRVAGLHLADIEAIARSEVRIWGRDYPVKAELGSFAFPAKAYGNLVLPPGEYEAVRVVIGAGQGANWWCVLFPPLCFVDVSKDINGPELKPAGKDSESEQVRQHGGIEQETVKVRFKLLEVFNRL